LWVWVWRTLVLERPPTTAYEVEGRKQLQSFVAAVGSYESWRAAEITLVTGVDRQLFGNLMRTGSQFRPKTHETELVEEIILDKQQFQCSGTQCPSCVDGDFFALAKAKTGDPEDAGRSPAVWRALWFK